MAISDAFKTESFQWDVVQSLGVLNRMMKESARCVTAGKLLEHCKNQITALRESTGGVRLCIFKVGVTTNPIVRFCTYVKQGFQKMFVLAISEHVDQIHMLEAACISEFAKHVGCKNAVNSGGEGALHRNDVVPPFYLYVVGGRADEGRWVL